MNGNSNQANQLYLVSNQSGRKLHIEAKTGETAKRIFCKAFDIRSSDPHCGIRALTAQRMTPEEAAEWKAQTETQFRTVGFIEEMLNLHAQVYKEAQAAAVRPVEAAEWKEGMTHDP